MLVRDRQRRNVRPTRRYGYDDLVAFAFTVGKSVEDDEPNSYEEVIKRTDAGLWQAAMDEEMKSLIKNNTWEIVEKPKHKKLVGCKWIYKKKEGIPGVEKPRYKARLVAKGYTQKEGIDFTEIFSPVVKHRTIRIILSIVAEFNLELEQLDVKTAFLYGSLDEEIFMRQPEGYQVGDPEQKVCLLKKSLYGLKQSPRQWYRRFDDFMISCKFERSQFDWCIYKKALENSSDMIYLLLYVDDMLIASKSKDAVEDLKNKLRTNFEMKELGSAKKILGMNITRDRKAGILKLDQKDYLLKVVNKFGMFSAKPVKTPLAPHIKLSKEQSPKDDEEMKYMRSVPYSNLVGCLMYSMVCTRPDIAHAVSMVSRYMANPGKSHWQALKWLLRYIKGSANCGLMFGNSEPNTDIASGYVDSDFAGCSDSRKSQTGFVFTIYGTAVSWRANLQQVVALSTTEAEYMAITEAVKEALWMKGIINDLGLQQNCVQIFCDSSGAINLSKHQVFHERSKHIDVRLHFVRDVVESGAVKVIKIHTDLNPADMLTKVIPSEKLEFCKKLIKLSEAG